MDLVPASARVFRNYPMPPTRSNLLASRLAHLGMSLRIHVVFAHNGVLTGSTLTFASHMHMSPWHAWRDMWAANSSEVADKLLKLHAAEVQDYEQCQDGSANSSVEPEFKKYPLYME